MPDLGLARAELLKQELIKLNAPADRIVTASTEVNAALFVRDYMIGGAGFDFIPYRLLPFTVETMLQNDSVVVYFEGGSTRFSVPSETRIYLENLRQYLLQNPLAPIQLTGHTDNSDTDDFNLQLGERRSNLLKKLYGRDGTSVQPNHHPKCWRSTTRISEHHRRRANEKPKGCDTNRQ